MTGKDRKNYRSIVSRRSKEIKEDPEGLAAYNDRARQTKKEAGGPGDDSQNEKMVTDGPAVNYPKKSPKSPGSVDTDSDDSDDEQKRVVK